MKERFGLLILILSFEFLKYELYIVVKFCFFLGCNDGFVGHCNASTKMRNSDILLWMH